MVINPTGAGGAVSSVNGDTGDVTVPAVVSIFSKAVEASADGASSCSFPGAQIGDQVVGAVDPSGVLDLMGDASPYFEAVVTVEDEVQQLRAIPSAEDTLPLVILARSTGEPAISTPEVLRFSTPTTLAAYDASLLLSGQLAWVDDVGTGFGGMYTMQATASFPSMTADGWTFVAPLNLAGHVWALRESRAGGLPRVTFVSDEIDFRTTGNYALNDVPQAAGKRFMLNSGRVVLSATDTATVSSGVTLNPGLSIGGVLTYRFTAALAISSATLNAMVTIPMPALVNASFAPPGPTPWTVLDLSGLGATPVVNVSSAVTGGTPSPVKGYVVLDGWLY